MSESALLRSYVEVHNARVRGEPGAEPSALFTRDGELAFEGVPIGPFRGRDAIARAFAERPPDDELVLDESKVESTRASNEVVMRYRWKQHPGDPGGRFCMRIAAGLIERLLIVPD